MRIADRDSRPWVIRQTTYFDHGTHRFAVGDIEIAGERIAAIKPAGTSALERDSGLAVFAGRRDMADARVDAATVSAVFSRPSSLRRSPGSVAFLRLFECRRPDVLIVGGQVVQGTGFAPLTRFDAFHLTYPAYLERSLITPRL